MNKDLYKELYLFEIGRKDKISDSVSTLITGMVIVGGAIGYFIENHSFSWDGLSIAFSMLLAVAIVLYALAIISLISIYGYKYQLIPFASSLKDYYVQLEEYYDQNPDEDGNPDSSFENYLNNRYAEATVVNAKHNDVRGAYQGRIFSVLAYSMMLTLLCSIPHFIKVHSTTYDSCVNVTQQTDIEDNMKKQIGTRKLASDNEDKKQKPEGPPNRPWRDKVPMPDS